MRAEKATVATAFTAVRMCIRAPKQMCIRALIFRVPKQMCIRALIFRVPKQILQKSKFLNK